MDLYCFNCGEKNEIADKPTRSDCCISCMADLRSCKNCEHYDANAWNECRETSAERVTEKEKANFCDYFNARIGRESLSNNENDSLKDKALADLDALFKK